MSLEMDNQNSDLLFIEYVPSDICKLIIGFKASAEVQAQLLAAGDVLLTKLSPDSHQSLHAIISCDKIDWLSQGGNPQDIIPERARAAIAVAEASQAMWALMFDYGSRVNKFSYQLAIDETAGVLIAGNKVFLAPYITDRIIASTGVSLDVALELWRKIMEMLREGFVIIPGVRAKKSEGYYTEISVDV